MSEVSTPRFYLTQEHHPENGTLLGFWLYLMSDCLVFACLFATYGVLGRSYAAGPNGAEIFDLPLVATIRRYAVADSRVIVRNHRRLTIDA